MEPRSNDAANLRARLAFALALVAVAAVAAPADAAGDAARGKLLYGEQCVACHGATGKGDGPAAAALTPPPPDLAGSAYWKTASESAIATAIEKGHGSMPPMDSDPQDVQDLIAYLDQAFRK